MSHKTRCCYLCRQPTGKVNYGYCVVCLAVKRRITQTTFTVPRTQADFALIDSRSGRVLLYAERAARKLPLFDPPLPDTLF